MRASAPEQPNQFASVFSAAGRLINAASLGQRGLACSGAPSALWRRHGILGSRSSIALSYQCAAASIPPSAPVAARGAAPQVPPACHHERQLHRRAWRGSRRRRLRDDGSMRSADQLILRRDSNRVRRTRVSTRRWRRRRVSRCWHRGDAVQTIENRNVGSGI
jgi:hypothetical protein